MPWAPPRKQQWNATNIWCRPPSTGGQKARMKKWKKKKTIKEHIKENPQNWIINVITRKRGQKHDQEGPTIQEYLKAIYEGSGPRFFQLKVIENYDRKEK